MKSFITFYIELIFIFLESNLIEPFFYILTARYIGMENGFFRMMPGAKLNPYYDPRIRPW